ncbi:conserved hypothetical protein [Hyphomicrobiales bacterium]|jgi:hypothetical protein|nr:conserved hypothetical protein [Hyphomicrobiales bacterium]CAH1702496.1 hypothetical protein BOSEA1005_30368 [Hyphomicrobiales bacterium]CAI0346697.1 conserved hypothetical protein [Hyphomicrobiales bacterium]
MPTNTPTASPEAIEAARTIARAICVEYRLTPEAYDRHGGEHPIIPVIVRHVAPALQGIAAPADNPEKGWDGLSETEKAVVSAWNYFQSPNSYSAAEKAFVFSLLDAALKRVWWAAVPNTDGWLDMASAPLTGRKVDLWVRPHDALANGNPNRIADAWYEDGRWMRIVSGNGQPAPVGDCGVPTHWRLPPAAPGATAENAVSEDLSWLRRGRPANELQSDKIDAHRGFVHRAAVHHANDRSYLNGVRGGFFDAAHLVDICRKEIEETGRPSKAKAAQVDLLQRVGDTIWGLKDVLPEPPAPVTAEVRRNG